MDTVKRVRLGELPGLSLRKRNRAELPLLLPAGSNLDPSVAMETLREGLLQDFNNSLATILRQVRLESVSSSQPPTTSGARQKLIFRIAKEEGRFRNFWRGQVSKLLTSGQNPPPNMPSRSDILRSFDGPAEKLVARIHTEFEADRTYFPKVRPAQPDREPEHSKAAPTSPPVPVEQTDPSREPEPSNSSPNTSGHSTEFRKTVDAFIDQVFRETGKKITRLDICRVAGYKEATGLERLQRGYRTSHTAKMKFRWVFALTSVEFLKKLSGQ